MLADAVHQFHENDLFTSAAAMSYFGLMTLFPALLLLLALSNRLPSRRARPARLRRPHRLELDRGAPRPRLRDPPLRRRVQAMGLVGLRDRRAGT